MHVFGEGEDVGTTQGKLKRNTVRVFLMVGKITSALGDRDRQGGMVKHTSQDRTRRRMGVMPQRNLQSRRYSRVGLQPRETWS